MCVSHCIRWAGDMGRGREVGVRVGSDRTPTFPAGMEGRSTCLAVTCLDCGGG